MEGCTSSSSCGATSKGFGYELTFCPNHTMSLCVGAVAATDSTAGASWGRGWIKTFALAANTRYAFKGFGAEMVHKGGFAGAQPGALAPEVLGPCLAAAA